MIQVIETLGRFAQVDASAAVAPVGGGGGTQLAIFALIFLGMWFLMIAPNRKRQKRHQEMLKRLKVGDRVLLSSGIFAKVVQIKGAHLVVEMSRGVRMEILRAYVQQISEKNEDGDEAESADNTGNEGSSGK